MRATLRALPTLLRIGFAEAIAYRAETIIWMLTNTMPLVNLALWSAVARGGTIVKYGSKDLVAYFLAALVVRQMTGSWVLWEMSQDIRKGLLSMRLLRPVHPIVAYGAENLSALPLRAGFALPVAAIGIAVAGVDRVAHDPVIWLVVCASLLGAWLINFFSMIAMGALGFYMEQSYTVFELWLAAFFTMSGYFFPLDFIAHRAPRLFAIAKALPFYVINGFPVELLLDKHDRASALHYLGVQWCWVLAFVAIATLLWRAGMKRYSAVGA